LRTELRLALEVVAAAWILTGAAGVRAQEGPYSNFLVGQRSLGFAGAYVAVADAPETIFHNPAGMADLRTTGASGSLWSLVRRSRVIEQGYRSELGASDLAFSPSLSLPLFLAGVVKFGRRDEDRVRRHALGVALLSPHTDQYRFVAQLRSDSAVDRIEVRHHDRARWYGLAYAYRLSPALSMGLSTFASLRSLEHDEVQIHADEGLPGDMAGAGAHSTSTTLDAQADHIIPRLGLHYDVSDEFSLGLMFQPPGVEFHQSVRAERLDTLSDAAGVSIDVAEGPREGVNLPVPWELRMGLNWVQQATTLLSLDVSVVGPVGGSGDVKPLVQGGGDELGLFVPRQTYREMALRMALGFETVPHPVFPIRGGVFFEGSSAPDVPDRSNIYLRDRLDSFGAAFSVGIRSGGYDLSVGATALLNHGAGLALVQNNGDSSYRVTDVSDTVLVLFIGGARGAMKRLVKTLKPEG